MNNSHFASIRRKNDELFTPKYIVRKLIPYLKTEGFRTIGCPADNEDSNFVSILRNAGFQVIATHVSSGQDFLTTPPPPHYDAIITNPPFSLKDQFLARCFSLNKPFLLLLPATIFDSDFRCRLFEKHAETVIIIINKRVKYINQEGIMLPRPSFQSIFVGGGFKNLKTLNYLYLENNDEID